MLRGQNSTDRNDSLQTTSNEVLPLTTNTGQDSGTPSKSKQKLEGSLKSRSFQRRYSCVIISLILVSAIGVWFVVKLINASDQIPVDVFNNVQDVAHEISSSDNFIRKNKIRAVRIVGERNSGTSWVFGFLQDCFNHTLYVKDGVTRYKHFFQPPMDPINVNRVYQNTLVIAVFRHPYYWVDGMMRKPHHGEYLLINPVEVIFYSLIMIYDVFHS